MATLIFTDNQNGISVYRANHCDAYGNPRCIVHFLNFLKTGEDFGGVLENYAEALKRAKRYRFRKYTAREFGGGFICQYDYHGGKDIAERVLKSREN